MVGTGHVVAERLGAPGADKDGAGVLDLAEQVHGVLAVELEVLGRDDVHGIDSGVEVVGHHDHAAVVEGGAGDLLARGLAHELLGGGEDAGGQLGVAGHEVAAGQGVMLGLRHEVGGHDHGVGRGVREHANL